MMKAYFIFEDHISWLSCMNSFSKIEPSTYLKAIPLGQATVLWQLAHMLSFNERLQVYSYFFRHRQLKIKYFLA